VCRPSHDVAFQLDSVVLAQDPRLSHPVEFVNGKHTPLKFRSHVQTPMQNFRDGNTGGDRFQHSKQQRDPRQLVLIEGFLVSTLELVKHTIGHASEQVSSRFVPQVPGACELKNRGNRRTTEPFLNLSARQVDSAFG